MVWHLKTRAGLVNLRLSCSHKASLLIVLILTLAGSWGRAQLALTEVMARNSRAIANSNTYPDWIEIRNVTSSDVNISGYRIYNIEINGFNNSTTQLFVLPFGLTLPADERLQ